MDVVRIEDLKKEFKVYEQPTGFTNTLKSFFKRESKIVKAVDGISFDIGEGELVGFIGENGAGKSTTIKIMSGILYPSRGNAWVNGIKPYENRIRNAMNIGVIFGQRSRLLWDLPMQDSFNLYKEIYRIDKSVFKKNVQLFTEMLGMGDFFKTPVRQLSLGQRMKVEIALALLHDPKILFLDEPTIGLDVLAKSNIRDFIVESNRSKGTTVILTSHDMKDLDRVCSRVIMISKGKLKFDGGIDAFKELYGGETLLKVTFADDNADSNIEIDYGPLKVTASEGNKKDILFDKRICSLQQAFAYITGNFDVLDITVKEPDIEEIVRGIYASERKH